MKNLKYICMVFVLLFGYRVNAQLQDLAWNFSGTSDMNFPLSEPGGLRNVSLSAGFGRTLGRWLLVGGRYHIDRRPAALALQGNPGSTTFPLRIQGVGVYGRGYLGHDWEKMPVYPFVEVYMGGVFWNSEYLPSTYYSAIQNRTSLGVAWWPTKRVSLEGQVQLSTRPKDVEADLNFDSLDGELGLYWTLGIWLGKRK